jgi:hypothetical protein
MKTHWRPIENPMKIGNQPLIPRKAADKLARLRTREREKICLTSFTKPPY